MLLAYDAAFLDHDTGPDHIERKERVTAVLDVLQEQPWAARVERAAPRAAKGEELLRVHDDAMLRRSRDLCAAGGGNLDADTVVVPASWNAALLAAGATIDAARAVVRGDAPSAYCLVRPPGHHATRTQAMGFCLLNNVALAAQRVLDLKSARRVAVFDHDVHHGNGTQDVFWERAEVLYVSLHQWPLYPGTGRLSDTGAGEGAGHTVNLPLPPGTSEAAYLQLVEEVVLPVAESFAPDLWLVSAGYDSHQRDLLGSLDLTSNAYPALLGKLGEVQRRMVVALEGGYHLESVARSAVGQMAWMMGEKLAWDEKPRAGEQDARPLVREARRVLGPWWRF